MKYSYFTYCWSICTYYNTKRYTWDIANCSIDTALLVSMANYLIGWKARLLLTICVACFAHANTELGIGYPEDLMQQMVAAKLMTELFEILVLPPTHWSWLNIQVLEKKASVDDQTVNYCITKK